MTHDNPNICDTRGGGKGSSNGSSANSANNCHKRRKVDLEIQLMQAKWRRVEEEKAREVEQLRVERERQVQIIAQKKEEEVDGLRVQWANDVKALQVAQEKEVQRLRQEMKEEVVRMEEERVCVVQRLETERIEQVKQMGIDVAKKCQQEANSVQHARDMVQQTQQERHSNILESMVQREQQESAARETQHRQDIAFVEMQRNAAFSVIVAANCFSQRMSPLALRDISPCSIQMALQHAVAAHPAMYSNTHVDTYRNTHAAAAAASNNYSAAAQRSSFQVCAEAGFASAAVNNVQQRGTAHVFEHYQDKSGEKIELNEDRLEKEKEPEQEQEPDEMAHDDEHTNSNSSRVICVGSGPRSLPLGECMIEDTANEKVTNDDAMDEHVTNENGKTNEDVINEDVTHEDGTSLAELKRQQVLDGFLAGFEDVREVMIWYASECYLGQRYIYTNISI